MSIIIEYGDKYTANCILAKPYLPKGHRFLKKGETVPCGAKHIGSNTVFYSSPCVGKEVRDSHVPIFVPAKHVRGAKERFAPKNPPSEFPDVKSVAPWRFLTPSIVALENVLSGDVGELEHSFEWTSARRRGRDVYWVERCHKRVALSPSDLDFIRAVKKEFEARLEAANPKPVPAPKPAPEPTLGEKIVKALEGRIASLKTGAELAALNKHYELAAHNTRDAKTVEDIVVLVKSLQ